MDPHEDISKMDPKTRVPNTLTVLQPGEHEICTIKRHPIGILGIYGLCGLVVIVTAVLAFGLAPGMFSSAGNQVMLVGALVFVVIAAICATFALIATKVYWGNTWTLTTDSLTQVNQISLFRRQSSQLSLENLEDVSSEQNGLLTRLFNYGLLRVETAGERSKFMFPFCPNPNYYAAQILSAREIFLEHTNKETGVYQQPVSPPPAPAAEPQIDSYEVPGGPDGAV
jgi:uncharacterized membrane protein YdbT with pleckstrin-like domain